MKNESTPRRVYVRNGVTHSCFDGSMFGPRGETKFMPGHAVRISDNEDGTVTVKRRPGHGKTVSEVWYPVKVAGKRA